ncbi:MAG: S1 RNA-binding domain-containing protein [Planctomycetes bacterium]|nr:S1 RNA-binding domain-containing protein [Planctomycetota bacterium]
MTTNPRSPSPSDDPLSREIDAALEGLSLQDLDAPPRGGGARKAPREGGPRTQKGVVVGVSGDDVIVELGPRMQGVAPLSDFGDSPPPIGSQFEFALRGRDDELWILSRFVAKAEIAIGDDVQPGALVKAKITGQNTGGLEARVGAVGAFLPASQVGLHREENLGQYLNQVLTCEVVEVDRDRKRIVLSRRKVLEKERDAARQETVGRLSVGQTVRGKVTRVEEFGAFVDLGGGVEGLVHVSQLSHQRIEKAGTHIQQGQEVEAQVLKIEDGGKRIGLGMKQLQPDPWAGVQSRFAVDSVVTGKVTRLMDFGAFVELAPGVEGLVHVSALAKDRVRHPKDVVKPGQELTVRIVAVEPGRSRISLSRLDPRGALLGSEESVDASVIDEALRTQNSKPLGTNLGSIFQRALEQGATPKGAKKKP